MNDGVIADVAMLAPENLRLSDTNKFDPPPRERVKLTEYHLTAHVDEKATFQQFVTVIRVRKKGEPEFGEASIEEVDGGYRVKAPRRGGEAEIMLRSDGKVSVRIDGVKVGSDLGELKAR